MLVRGHAPKVWPEPQPTLSTLKTDSASAHASSRLETCSPTRLAVSSLKECPSSTLMGGVLWRGAAPRACPRPEQWYLGGSWLVIRPCEPPARLLIRPPGGWSVSLLVQPSTRTSGDYDCTPWVVHDPITHVRRGHLIVIGKPFVSVSCHVMSCPWVDLMVSDEEGTVESSTAENLFWRSRA